jgi:rod shape determining protein RodA
VISVGWLTIFASKLPLKKIFISALVMSAIIPLGWFLLKPYQQQRIRTFIDPYADPLGAGYHVIQSITSVGSGQLFGRGLGHGTQSQLRFLPEHYTDFIFASLSEELGFTGSALIIALYLLILWRVYSISQSTPDPACAHYALGLVSMLFFQIFVNIGMNMGIAPVTGITLPFISAGGSSLLSLAISIGILTSISKSAKSSTTYQIR